MRWVMNLHEMGDGYDLYSLPISCIFPISCIVNRFMDPVHDRVLVEEISWLQSTVVVVVDLERNLITTSEEIPPIPDPEYRFLCGEILKLLHPNVVSIDQMKAGSFSEQGSRGGSRPCGEDHDLHLR
ncbi:Scytalone dehydratase [Orobanche minor]